MEIVTTKTIRTERRKHIELNSDAIRELLKLAAGIDVPADASITIQVPGGGDWSNTSLNVDDRTPVVVAWTEVEQS